MSEQADRVRALQQVEEDELNLLEYGMTLWRHRGVIIGFCLVVIISALVTMLSMPKTYESTVALLAPKETAGGSLLGGLAGSGLLPVPGLSVGLSIPSLTPNRDMVVSILKSRTVVQAVVERFGLRERYGVRYVEEAVKELQDKRVQISVTPEGVISLTVEDKDPAVAAQMANFFVQQTDRLVSQFGTGEAGRERGFLTEQLARAKTDLETAETALRGFQERNRAIILQDQTREAIEGAARLKGEIIAAEVQLQVMRSFATEANPDIAALRRRIEEMKRQLAQVEYGDGPRERRSPAGDQPEFHVPFVRVPEVGLELARLTRDVKIQETVVTLLTQQLEQARLGEAKDIPIVRVLDPAVPAEQPSKPPLFLGLAIAGALSLLLGMFLAFSLEYLEHLRSIP